MIISIKTISIKNVNCLAEPSNQLGYPTDEAQINNRLSEILNRDNHCVYTAEIDGKTVGWIHGFLPTGWKAMPLWKSADWWSAMRIVFMSGSDSD